jgi:hypothetical protein
LSSKPEVSHDCVSGRNDLVVSDFDGRRDDDRNTAGTSVRLGRNDGGCWEHVFPHSQVSSFPMCFLEKRDLTGVEPSPDALAFPDVSNRVGINEPPHVP